MMAEYYFRKFLLLSSTSALDAFIAVQHLFSPFFQTPDFLKIILILITAIFQLILTITPVPSDLPPFIQGAPRWCVAPVKLAESHPTPSLPLRCIQLGSFVHRLQYLPRHPLAPVPSEFPPDPLIGFWILRQDRDMPELLPTLLLASNLGVTPDDSSPMTLYFPPRDRSFAPARILDGEWEIVAREALAGKRHADRK